MAQQFIYYNDLMTTVNFSTVGAGEVFIQSDMPCLRIEGNQNPNWSEIGGTNKGKLNDTDQVLLPNKITIKVE